MILKNVDLKIHWPDDLSGAKPGFPQHLSTVTINPAAADITCVQIEGLYQSYLWGRKRDFLFAIPIQKKKKSSLEAISNSLF